MTALGAMRQALHGQNSVRVATALMIVTLTFSNLLGLLRDRLLAAKIPANLLDSYYAAFRLPDLLTNLIVVGAIAVVFVPIFTELKTKEEAEAWEAANAILNLMLVILAIGSLVLVVAMPFLMPFVVPEFSRDSLSETIRYARWLSITPILFGLSYILSGILNSFHRFVVYALAPLVYNLSIIAGTVFLSPRWGIAGVIAGVIAGAFLHMLIQLPVARGLGWHWQRTLTFRHPAIAKFKTLTIPRMISLFAMQLSTIIATALASAWSGAITYYNLANNIQTMPSAVFASSIATALFPTLSLSAARQDSADFRSHLVQGIRWLFFLLIPATAGLIMLRIQIVRLVLGAGHFGWEATRTTADVLGWFALSLVASGMVPLLARAYYARQEMYKPMFITLVSASLTILLSIVLSQLLPASVTLGAGYQLHIGEVAALAIAFSSGTILQAMLLLRALQKDLDFRLSDVTRSLGKIFLATGLMVFVVQIVKQIIGTIFPLEHFAELLLQTIIAISFGILTYSSVVAALRCPEWHELLGLVKKKISFAK